VPSRACAGAPTGEFTINLRSGGLTRSAFVHIPSAGAARRLPVLLAFHGAGGDGRFMAEYSGLSALADKEHFAVVYPTAGGRRHFWTLNSRDPTKPADVAFISSLLDDLPHRACVDMRRVYATGVSNGGGFTARLGCELSWRLAAIAPVAGGYRSLDACDAAQPVSVLEIHGTADTVVPYDGKPPDFAGSVPRFLEGWAARDDCTVDVAPVFVAPRTERFDWRSCANGTEVLHYRLSGVGHTWPGSRDSSTAPIAAGRTIWRFFRGRALAQ
jgi:polyhydroxybutyrate depolymerase